MVERGAVWRRWEPHIHGPGTILNNQYGGPTIWADYIKALESAQPKIEAIAVTDYYVLETYKHVLAEQRAGRLADAKLVFPNIEMRLDVAAKSGFVNIHLFVCPDDDDHMDQIERLLKRLDFRAFGERFDCTRAELIRLGRKVDPSIAEETKALSLGATQFKVNFDKLRDVINESPWAQKNVIVAVAGSMHDGTSGVREAADATIRAEIEKFADVIFSSSDQQREFWLGDRSLSEEQIRARYKSLKPCMHGSDAHHIDKVANPFGDRFTWIKGDLTFDALRQACIDPRNRAYIGSEPPGVPSPSQIISKIEINDALWMQTPTIQLNGGLVAVIGARGSGKTALADIIAAGCDAIPEAAWNAEGEASASFLARARDLIGDASVDLEWGDGGSVHRLLDGSDNTDGTTYPRARYLSQQFVETLCSSHGLSDGLLREIERVIFQSHPVDHRDGATNFTDLLNLRVDRYRQARSREAEAIAQISESIGAELEKERLVPSYEVQVQQKTQILAGYEADRKKLVTIGNEQRAKRHFEVMTAAEKVRGEVNKRFKQKQIFIAMQDEVQDQRQNTSPKLLRESQTRHRSSNLTPEMWQDFLLDYKGPVDERLEGYITWADNQIVELKGAAPVQQSDDKPYFDDAVDLGSLKLLLLEAEVNRLGKLIGADKEKARQYAEVTSRIVAEQAALEELKKKLIDAKGARDRATQLNADREAAYKRVFDAVLKEQAILSDLYEPLLTKLSTAKGTLKKLSFTVIRKADVIGWADEAEEHLLDRRKGSLKGKGTLTERANEMLRSAWEVGDPDAISKAMASFRQEHLQALMDHAPVSRADHAEFRQWAKRFAQWLYSTEHIQILYGIEYDGVDIRKLSPGTRGVVLLLLYLALDEADDRPLIIDQPEENLDPKSVYDELVPLFIQAKSRRQVIIVTHNANLVINTDADQIIIAEAGPHPHGDLPPITYVAGGLDNAAIRKAVCEILEGGETAFRERARRLRVNLQAN